MDIEIISLNEIDGHRNMTIYSYPFQKTDGGRSQSKRPRQNNDCTVRAFALAFNLSYDEAYDYLKDLGRKCSRGFFLNKWLDKQKEVLGYKIGRLSFPAKKGQKRMNPSTFSKQFKKGTYLIRTAKHMSIFIDGVLYDSCAERPDRCIYTAWKIN